MSDSGQIKKTNGRALSPNIFASAGEPESQTFTNKEESVTTDPTRNPNVPSIFTRKVDPTTGQPTNIYWGPSSPNDVIQVYIFDPGNGQPLRTEYCISGPYPDVDYLDAENIAEEIYQFIARWSADVIFGSNGEIAEVA